MTETSSAANGARAAASPFEVGVYSFADLTPMPQTGGRLSPQERMRNLIEEITLADQVGLDVYGLGEHHRPEYISSAPEVILAAAASLTRHIRLTSAVTVLSSDDPVRVFQQFATLDLISDGRAEIMAGRGSFIESFPLFGYELNDYNELFEEKLEMLLEARKSEILSWSGKHTQTVPSRGVYPRPVQDPLPVWVAVGGTPESVVRAARLGLPMAIAIIGGNTERFVPFADLYREVLSKTGQQPLPLSINSHGLIARESRKAVDIAFPAHKLVMDQLGRERGWPPMSRQQFEADTGVSGSLAVGSPEEIIEKILYQHELFGHQRYLVQISVGSMPHEAVLESIELLGTEVAPVVRKEIASRTTAG